MKRPSSPAKSPGEIQSISDFATYLGLSYCTVSRALNGHPMVKAETRERILREMDAIGFRPNPFARSLRGQGLGLIGICVVGVNAPILSTKIFHLQKFLRDHNLRGLLEIAEDTQESELRVIEDFVRIRTEGIVLIYSCLPAATTRDSFTEIPFVHVDPQDMRQVPSVALDRPKAMTRLFDHLFELGHRRFALMGVSRKDRWRGPALERRAQEVGLDPDCCFEELPKFTKDSSISQGRALVERYLRNNPDPATAFIALDDVTAIGVTEGIRRLGYRVPEDFSVTGFDHLEIGQELTPSLTTIEQESQEMMDAVGKLLLQEISNKRSAPSLHLVEPRIVLGQSTGPVRSHRLHSLT
ncbi:LacI family DNA-binding transcriptional regulator [Terrimicrobium sacchariphilum]|uniref:LacI family DNA-binding transcriptional regulator n=1 Tax=Terrimicrobium sacchariphilum TaxID=690879 RepID=UPI00129B2E12|nr:LacI family DNA-binding transcriptional regulator [Terrimicrobium sacchariphilum]